MTKRFLAKLAVLAALVGTPAFAVTSPDGLSFSITQVNAGGAGTVGTTADTAAIPLLAPANATIFSNPGNTFGTVAVTVTGTFSATLTFEASLDEGTTWASVAAVPAPLSGTALGAQVTSTTATGKWLIPAVGLTNIHVTCTSFTSGTAVVVLERFRGSAFSSVPAQSIAVDGNGVDFSSLPATSQWSVTNTSAANAQATAAKAAGATGVKHVTVGFCGQLVGDATGNADFATINLRDGATGAGTVLASFRVNVATGANATGVPFCETGFWVGTAATAATVEMSAAGATHTIGIVSAQGYDTK